MGAAPVGYTVRATIELRAFAGHGRLWDLFLDELKTFRQRLPETSQPLLVGPIRVPFNDGPGFIFVHDGHVVTDEEHVCGKLWVDAVDAFVRLAARYIDGRVLVAVWGDVAEPVARELYLADGRLWSDGDYTAESGIPNFPSWLQNIAEPVFAAMFAE
jgi:hypothetical protein